MRSSTFPHLRRMFVCLVAMCAAGTVGILSIAHAQVGKPEGLYYKSWAVVVGVENYLVAPKVPGALESAHAVAAALRCRVRYFTDGAVLGGQRFVDEFFESKKGQFGERRKDGGRRRRGAQWGGLRVLRDLRTNVVG